MYLEPGMFGPNIIMDRNVIYVNFNYRLGPLGFLSTEDEVLPGNLGLKDQVAALKWIKENIQYFGGNPDSVTLTGVSAGGSSVQLHYLSPLSRGLFNRGISQSGSALSPWILQENAREKAVRVAEILGCVSESSQEIVNCLRQRSGRQIVNTVKDFQVGFMTEIFTHLIYFFYRVSGICRSLRLELLWINRQTILYCLSILTFYSKKAKYKICHGLYLTQNGKGCLRTPYIDFKASLIFSNFEF